MKLVIATRNAHKLAEVRALFALPHLVISSARDYPDIPDVIEDGKTFEANAAKKALAIAQATGCWALGDDSGLEVDALNLAPGVYSARYAGESASYEDNNRKLLKELAGHEDRRARFRCAIALASPTGTLHSVAGACEGRIITDPRGTEGFGYDPLFVPEGHTNTFAEMAAAEKNRISHRGRALAKARERWATLLAAAKNAAGE